MNAPILFPSGLDALLFERFAAEKLYFRAWASRLEIKTVARQRKWVERLNARIVRAAA